MKIKVAELEGAKLDYFVARAAGHILKDSLRDGWQEVRTNDGAQYFLGFLPSDPDDKNLYPYETFYSPSTSWEDGGPIIERERIKLDSYPWEEGAIYWKACTPSQINKNYCSAKTPLIAAMRCFVSSRLGEEVEG
jgi:hypothetical protein